MKHVSILQYDYKKQPKEINSGEYVLREEKTLSIREIVEKFAQGYDIGEYRSSLHEGDYLNDDDIDNIDNPDIDPDISDIFNAQRDLEERINKTTPLVENAVKSSENEKNPDEKEQPIE